MHFQSSLLWSWHRTIDRFPYLLTGVLLFLVKFAIDWTIATQVFSQSWSPLNYIVWPNDRVLRVFELGDPERWFSLTMLLLSLPFIWMGVILTLHRLRATGLPLSLIVLFFVPLVNLLLFLVLIVLPSQEVLSAVAVPRPRRFEPLRRAHRTIVHQSYWRSGLAALAVSVPCAVLGVIFGAQVLQSYGFGLFVGAPFALGMISVLLFGFSRPQPLGACLIVAVSASALAGLAILLVALEGAICLIMAAPIALVLTLLGAFVGYAIQARRWLNDQIATLTLAVLITLPALMAAESVNEPEPTLRAVHTEVIIDAPPVQVWPCVIAFPPLPEPNDWIFQTGIAYPQRAEIEGTGVGAVRNCIFSTGSFIEPIEVWEPPTLLRFRVSAQPEPMREWSPYHIHPAHMDDYSSQSPRPVLSGSASRWPYALDRHYVVQQPHVASAYWNLWSDYIIHRIHGRVLTHIQKLAEMPTQR